MIFDLNPIKTISVKEFEKKVFNLEGIHIICLADAGKQVLDFDFTEPSSSTQSLKDWTVLRLNRCLGNVQFQVFTGHSGTNHRPSPLTSLGNQRSLRSSTSLRTFK